MLAYLYALLAGDIDAVRAALLYGSLLGGIIVVGGILWESGKLTRKTAVVILGVCVESFCTWRLFVADELVSNAQLSVIRSQNDKIIALETQLLPRSLTKEQFDAIQTLKGHVVAINLAVEVDSECRIYAAELATALMHAGIAVHGYELPWDMRGNSGLAVYDQHMFSENSVGALIFETLKGAKIDVVFKTSVLPDALDAPRDIPTILVYEKRYVLGASPPYLGPPGTASEAPVPPK